MATAVSNFFSLSVTAAASLPASGSAMRMTDAGDFLDGGPAGWSLGNVGYALWGAFGSGCFNPYYSANGAYIMVGSGGHSHPSVFGASVFDFTTMEWDYLPCANAGISDSTGSIQESDSNGSPWWEMNASAEVPLPPHPYKNLMVRSPAQGGGTKGSMIYVGRGSVGNSGVYSSGAAHQFDLTSRSWSRLSTATSFGIGEPEVAVTFDAITNRYYQIPETLGVASNLKYLDGADWTFKSTANWSGYASNVNTGTNCAWIHELGGTRALFSLRGPGPHYLSSLNLASPGSGWNNNIALSGETLIVDRSDVVFHPLHNCYYRRYTLTDTPMLQRLIPPTGNILTGAWTVENVTLGGDAIPVYKPVSGIGSGEVTSAYKNLMYVPALGMLAWVTGNGVFLLNPPAP